MQHLNVYLKIKKQQYIEVITETADLQKTRDNVHNLLHPIQVYLHFVLTRISH